ncbi:MAG: ATP-binding protein [Nevskia sp.]|nr:ATP-binding protein [Nevskia sp.]
MITAYPEKNAFGAKLNSLVSPSRPVQTAEKLFGRDKELERIDRAFFAEGRHIFIYGSRGVGKSSLAAAAANQQQSADANYIDVSCSRDATLASIVANIAQTALGQNLLQNKSSTTSFGASLSVVTASHTVNSAAPVIASAIRTLPDAVEVLRQAAETHSKNPVVVLDEFNLLADAAERTAFSDLLKILGDKKVGLRFIFTGVAESLNELLGANESAYRQLETIELPKLAYQARMDIVQDVADGLGVSVDRDFIIRIASISDGFPYYVHLLTEKLMWRVFDDQEIIDEANDDHFEEAVKDAIETIAAQLKRPYELALRQRSGDIEPVIWATADGDVLARFVDEMYQSYQRIMEQLDEAPLDRKTFMSRLQTLRKETSGGILVRDIKPGLYTYREKMLRGYVRLQAEANHIRLPGDVSYTPERQVIRAPSRASTGFHGPSTPKGFRFRGEKKPSSRS